jgi:hypothetical protein
MRWRLLVLVIGVCLAAAPAPADDAELGGWKQRLERAEGDVVRTREDAAAAHAAYVSMRHNRSVRGEEKAKVIAARAESEHAAKDAQARLDTLREEARRAGVPPAWLLPEPPAEPSP